MNKININYQKYSFSLFILICIVFGDLNGLHY